MGAAVSVVFRPGTTDDAMRAAAAVTPMALANAIRRVVVVGVGRIQTHTPVGATGALRGGYRSAMYRVGSPSPRGVIINAILYHDWAEDGRAAGRPPPVEAIMPWVGTILGVPPGPERWSVAFRIARAIGRRGTTGAHMVEEGWRETVTVIRPELAKMGYHIVSAMRRSF